MKFLEISKTVCVNKDSIAWVSSADNGISSIIFVGGKEYPSDIPYQILVDMLQQNEPTMEKLDKYLSVATIQTP
jgi:hypothetical protein